jgi:hypothetical protein
MIPRESQSLVDGFDQPFPILFALRADDQPIRALNEDAISPFRGTFGGANAPTI